jgi:hypothetical protein
MVTTDTQEPSTSLARAMAALDSDIAAAVARFRASMRAGAESREDHQGMTPEAFALICTTCTALTRQPAAPAGVMRATCARKDMN